NGPPAEQNTSTNLVKGMAMLAKNLHLNLVAEGIETKGQSQLLRSMGYGIGQGYFFSAPLPGQEAGSWFLKMIGRSNQS
ncbi:MAG: EAL domain-containing protein, partial [Desulfovermiculus sp.]|nr:EAL domain-containing protein [Desulfovermiculus sp.]